MKIKSDHFKEYEKDQEERNKSLKAIGITTLSSECEPADLYGKRVNLDMEDKTNLEKTADDIQDVYCMEPSPIEPDNGGLAKEDDDSSY